MSHSRMMFGAKKVGYLYGTNFADMTEIIPHQIYDHDVLTLIFCTENIARVKILGSLYGARCN